MADDALQARVRRRTSCSCGYAGLRPVVVHGGGPQITAMLDRLGVESEFRGGLRVTTPEAMDVVRMVLTGQVQRELVGLINAHGPFAVGLSGRGRPPVHRASAATSLVDGEPSTSGWSATSSRSRPDVRRRACSTTAGSRSCRTVARGRRRPGLQRQRRHRRGRAGRRAGRREARRAHRRRGPLRGLAGQRRGDHRARPPPSSRRCCRRCPAGWSRRWRPACAPSAAACRKAHVHRRPGAARAAAGGLHRRGRRHDGDCRDRRHDRHAGAAVSRRRLGTLAERWHGALMDNFGTPPLVLVRGEGCYGPGRRRQARTSTCSPASRSTSLGHAHPAVVEAVTAQVADARPHLEPLRHRARGRARRAAARAARRRRRRPGVLLPTPAPRPTRPRSSSRRRTGRPQDRRGRGRRSTAARWARCAHRPAGQARAVRAAARRASTFVPYGDADALAAAVDDDTAAVVLEPIQGEAGVVVPPAGLPRGRRARDHRAAGALLVARRGADRHRPHRRLVRAPRAQGVAPDVVTLAKGLGGGLPIGACVGARRRPPALLGPGQHGSTFGGNPVACAAALAVLDTIESRRPAGQRAGASARGCATASLRARPPARRRRPRRGPAARRSCSTGRCAGAAAAARATPASSSTRRSRTRPAGAAADPERRRGRRVPRRAAGGARRPRVAAGRGPAR